MLAHLAHPTCYSKLHFEFELAIVTSREKEEDKRRGIEAGADAYIVKGDFDQNNLVDTLRTLLG